MQDSGAPAPLSLIQQADGVICGHIHYATIRDENGIRYMNCGDWVESCTAIGETSDGRLRIINWQDVMAARQHHRAHAVAATARELTR